MVGARSFDLDDTGEVFAVYSVKARVVCVGLGGVLGQVASTGVCVPLVPLVPSGTPLASVMSVVFSRVECSPQVLYSSRPDGMIVVVVVEMTADSYMYLSTPRIYANMSLHQ